MSENSDNTENRPLCYIAAVVVTAPASATAGILAAVAIGSVIACTANVVKQTVIEEKDFKDIDPYEVMQATAIGGASTAIATTGTPVEAQVACNALLTSTATLINGGSLEDIAANGIVGAIAGYFGGNGATYQIASSLLYSKTIVSSSSIATTVGTMISLFFDEERAKFAKE